MPAALHDSMPGSNGIFRKTKACKFHLMGRCTRGEACVFAHEQNELQPLPDFRYTKMCPALCETGRCDKGSACMFAHSTKELRHTSARSAGGAAKAAATARARALVGSATVTEAQPAAPGPTVELPPATRAVVVQAQVLLVPSGAQPVLLLAQAPVQQQPLQTVIRLPPATCRAQRTFGGELPPPPDHAPEISEDALREALHAFDAPAEKCPSGDAGLDLPNSAWSRQSTEDVDEPFADFSRQSTQEMWVGMDELETRDEQADLSFAEKADSVPEVMDRSDGGGESSACSLVGPQPSPALLPAVAAKLGIEYDVVNTFLEFRHHRTVGMKLSRSHSTGECLSRGI